jgi:hypothetical protein
VPDEHQSCLGRFHPPAFLARLPLLLSLRIKDGDIEYREYASGSASRPILSSFAERGLRLRCSADEWPMPSSASVSVDLIIEKPRRRVGRGEVVVIGENLGIRLTEICLPVSLDEDAEDLKPSEISVEARLLLGKTKASLKDIVCLERGMLVELNAKKPAPAKLELGAELSMPVDIVVADGRFCARVPYLPSSSQDEAACFISSLLKEGQESDRRRAAVCLIAVGVERAVEIFKRLHEEEIESLTFEIARLDAVEPEEAAQALATLNPCASGTAATVPDGGIDYAREVLERSVGTQKTIDIINRLTASLQARPFDFIRRADPLSLFNSIISEHPQTIALVLSFLEPPKTADILQRLPPPSPRGGRTRPTAVRRNNPKACGQQRDCLEGLYQSEPDGLGDGERQGIHAELLEYALAVSLDAGFAHRHAIGGLRFCFSGCDPRKDFPLAFGKFDGRLGIEFAEREVGFIKLEGRRVKQAASGLVYRGNRFFA